VTARAALVCHRITETGSISAEFTYWADTDEAGQAEAELSPCGPLCVDIHTVVRLDTEAEPRRRPSLKDWIPTGKRGPYDRRTKAGR
jgi:hypothetical protein